MVCKRLTTKTYLIAARLGYKVVFRRHQICASECNTIKQSMAAMLRQCKDKFLSSESSIDVCRHEVLEWAY